MRFSLKAKAILVITLLTFLVVATTTLLHFVQLTRIAVEEALGQAELISKQIYAQSSRALSRAPGGTPREILRRDPELRSLIGASVGYSPDLIYALLADESGRVILHTQPQKEGSDVPARPTLPHLLALDPLRRAYELYRPGSIYEVVFPILLDGRPFGSIRLGVTTGLLRRELNTSLTQSLVLAGAALPLAWLVAMGLANLTLKPIRRLAREMERLRQEEFAPAADLGREDEFKELASQLQLLGQQLQSDRLKSLSEKAHLQQVVDQLEDGLIFFTQERRILFLNRAAEAVLGRSSDQALGGTLEEVLEPSHPLRSLPDRGREQSGGFRNATLTLPRDGKPKEFLVSAFSVGDDQKRMGTMVLLKDLESARTLQSLVSYSAKLAALGRLTSGVAHEVKNPLNAMMIHLELLKEKLGTSPEEARESAAVIESEIRRLDWVVQGFLKFVRPQEMKLKPVDLNALLGGLISLLRAEWEGRGIRFVFQEDAGLRPVTGDEELLHQVFLNILLNACQAMPEGGTITVTSGREGHRSVTVCIADEGVGIPPEELDKIFRLYYTTKPEGSGVGLALAYRIVQQHDGSIEVSSEVGRGTKVSVRLPLD